MQVESIVNVKSIGEHKTIDIEVDHPKHVFYGDGLAGTNSHSVSYAINSYISAYAKAHFPFAFYTSYLHYSKNKPDTLEEIHRLVNDAKILNIDIHPPSLYNFNQNFKLIDNEIYFGLSNIKHVGESTLKKILDNLTIVEQIIGRTIKDWTWLEFLLFMSFSINSQAIVALISSGGLDYMNISRSQMLYEYSMLDSISKKELEWMKEWYKSKHLPKEMNFKDILYQICKAPSGRKPGCGCSSRKRQAKLCQILESVKNPPYSLIDSATWTANAEQMYMGVSLTCSAIDDCDFHANATCRDFLQQVNLSEIVLIGCKITNVNVIKTKKGKNPGQPMAFVTVEDNTGMIDSVVIFPKQWKELSKILVENNKVVLSGKRGKEKTSFIVDKARQI